MKNPIEEQRAIIDQLYQIVIGSCPADFASAKCRFEYGHGHDDGSISVGSAFSFIKDGQENFPALDRSLRKSVKNLVPDLHAKMLSHTGGDWDAFTLFINENGTVTTKFEYADKKSST